MRKVSFIVSDADYKDCIDILETYGAKIKQNSAWQEASDEVIKRIEKERLAAARKRLHRTLSGKEDEPTLKLNEARSRLQRTLSGGR